MAAVTITLYAVFKLARGGNDLWYDFKQEVFYEVLDEGSFTTKKDDAEYVAWDRGGTVIEFSATSTNMQ